MVTTRSSKAAKFTYTERVLGALSQVQKDHRKHSVHVATLRAKVRKNAEVKKDKLGPRWSQWVGKAIHRLEDDGILEPAESGSVALTPTGKKAMITARRSLRSHANNSSAHPRGEEDLVVRHVAQHASHKRSRTQLDVATDDHPDVGSISAMSKRRRSTIPTKKKPITKMTKAELLNEVRLLQRDHVLQVTASRSSSPLTDLSEDESVGSIETSSLKRELLKRQEQIEQLQGELIKARRHATTPMTQMDDINQSVMSTPTPDFPIAPIRPMPQSKSFPGVTRTQSGSFISHLSKQPTPAPSTPEDEDNYQETLYDLPPASDTVFTSTDMQLDSQESEQNHAALAVAQKDKIVELNGEINGLRSEMERLESLVSSNTNLLILKNTELFEREALLTSLRAEKALVDGELGHMQQVLNKNQEELSKHVRIEEEALNKAAALDSQVQTLLEERNVSKAGLEVQEKQYIELNARFETQCVTILGLEKRVRELGEEREFLFQEVSRAKEDVSSSVQKTQGLERDVEMLQQRLSVSADEISSLIVKQNDNIGTIKQLHETLSKEQSDNEALRNDVAAIDKDRQTQKLCLEDALQGLEEMRKKLKETEALSSSLSSKLDALQTLNAENCEEIKSSNTQISSLTRELEIAQEEIGRKQADLEKATLLLNKEQDENRQIAHDLNSKETELLLTKEDLNKSESTLETLRNELAAREHDVQQLQIELSSAKISASTAEKKLEEVERTHGALRMDLQSQIDSLHISLVAARADTGGLLSDLRSTQTALEKTRGDLEISSAGLSHTQVLLTEELNRSSSLERELRVATEKLRCLEAEVLELESLKATDEQTINGLKNTFKELHQLQMKSWADHQDKVSSAHSSTASKPRLFKGAPEPATLS